MSVAATLFGFALTWITWELTLGLKLAARGKQDAGAIALAAFTGFAFPWGGVLLAYVLEALR